MASSRSITQPPAVDEDPAVAFQLLHDEALTAEQAGHDPALELHADLHTARAYQKLSFWQIRRPPCWSSFIASTVPG